MGRDTNLSANEATALVEAFIRAQYAGNLKSLAVSNTATQVDVTVTVTVPMTFMQVLNTQSVDVTVSSTAVRPQGKLEVALVLDQTGSMAGQKIANLKLAAKDLIDIVVWNNQTDDYYSKVAIVPYAAGVNVGTYAPSVRGPRWDLLAVPVRYLPIPERRRGFDHIISARVCRNGRARKPSPTLRPAY